VDAWELAVLRLLERETEMSGAKVSALDAEVLRSAFRKAVLEEKIPEDLWQEYAALMIRDFTGSDDIDTDLLEWIVHK
jgi:hypothetical protein